MQDSKLSAKRVFIIGTGSMFDDGFTQLMTCGTGLHVSTTKYTNERGLLSAIEQNQPDVILLVEAGLPNPTRVLNMLSVTPSLASLRLIIVWLSNNVIDVYEKPLLTGAPAARKRQRIIIKTRDDLLAAVCGK
jgi:hypothetical protein